MINITKLKYSCLLAIFLGLVACNNDNTLTPIDPTPVVLINAGTVDFSKYVAVGASFTAGFTDGALFKKGQENSFPNILSKKIKMIKGNEKSTFKQPLMSDNIGGLLFKGHKISISKPRLYLDTKTKKPTLLKYDPTTEVTKKVMGGPFNNLGIPGLKSFHLLVPGYGNLTELTSKKVNPYFARMSSSATATVLQDALVQKPTFFTLSEIGGNDILRYAISGGEFAKYQKGNMDPRTYKNNDITDPILFANVFMKMVDKLTADKAKGALTTLPSIETLPFFTTVPYNSIILTKEEATSLNAEMQPIVSMLKKLGHGSRLVELKEGNNPVLIFDESLENLNMQISDALELQGMPFPKRILVGGQYGQSRHATPEDKILITTSTIIGKDILFMDYIPSIIGINHALKDRYVLTKKEINTINEATEAYNNSIISVARTKKLALVDLKKILEQAANTGIVFDDFTLTTRFVTGGLFSLDGIHLTSRGYAFMANKFLEAIDKTYGSNFGEATNGLAKAKDYPITYSKDLK